jgi:hypothetical protein
MDKLSFYQANDIHLVWEKVKPHIERALEHSYTHTLGDIAEGLISGAMQLWTYGDFDAAMVTDIDHDRVRFCTIILLAGDGFDNYKHYLDVIEQWAKDNGCKEIRVYGRKGWSRVLNDYKEMYRVLGKEL